MMGPTSEHTHLTNSGIPWEFDWWYVWYNSSSWPQFFVSWFFFPSHKIYGPLTPLPNPYPPDTYTRILYLYQFPFPSSFLLPAFVRLEREWSLLPTYVPILVVGIYGRINLLLWGKSRGEGRVDDWLGAYVRWSFCPRQSFKLDEIMRKKKILGMAKWGR